MISLISLVSMFSLVWAQSPEGTAAQPEPVPGVAPLGEPVDVEDMGEVALDPQVEPAPFNAGDRPGGATVVATGTSAPISVDGTGILVVLTDLEGRVPSGGARIRVGEDEASATLLDSGDVPDMKAGDAIYTGLLVAPGSGARTITVETETGETLWTDEVTLQPDLESPSLRIDFGKDGQVTASYRSDGAGVQTPAFQGGGPAPVSGDGMTPQVVNAAPSGVQNVGVATTGADSWLPVWLALGLILGAFGGAWARVRSRRAPALVRVGGPGRVEWPLGLGDQETPQVVGLGSGVDDERVLTAAIHWFSERCTVLVVPRPESRTGLTGMLEGTGSVFWMEEDRPTVAQVQRAVDHLELIAPVVVVVQGPGALEEPDPDETPDAVIMELGELETAVCALLPEDSQSAARFTCRLESGEGGYRGANGLLVRGDGLEPPRWVEVSE